VRLNDEVLSSLKEITGQIAQVVTVVSEITVASAGQVDGVSRMTRAVSDVNGITQQVAASAEESASAAEELNAQASTLNDTVTTFALEDGDVYGSTSYQAPKRSNATRAKTYAR
jgi:methyl-accepting chemotaxis protein